MISTRSSRVRVQRSRAPASSLRGFSLAMRILVAPLGDGVLHPQRPPAGRRGPRCRPPRRSSPSLQLAPGHVVLLRADQAEDVVLAAVLADQRGRQAEPAAGLDLGRDAEDRGRQQVDLVVDDQAPVALGRRARSAGSPPSFSGAVGDDLVGGEGDRARSPCARRCTRRPASSVRSVLSRISRRHCLTAVMLVVRISVDWLDQRHGRDADDRSCPRRSGSTMTPLPPRTSPPAWNASAASAGSRAPRSGRPAQSPQRHRQRRPRCSRPGPRPGSRRRSAPA